MIGRFNLATADAEADDAKVRVRGLGVMISTPDRQECRMAMIDPPFFTVSTPEAFHALQLSSQSKEPDAMAKFAGANPEFKAFAAWAKSAPWTGSYAEERYNSLDSFIFIDSSGNDHAVRWSLAPTGRWSRSRPRSLRSAGLTSSKTRLPSASRAARCAGRCWSLSPTPAIRPRTPARRGRKTVAASRLAR